MEAREQKKLRAFVIMPFDEEFDGIYTDLILPAFEDEDFEVIRADNIEDQQNIMKGIVIGIEEADIIVADVTALNPNVLYELGLSHGRLRPTVIITQGLKEIPYDLRGYRVIPYSTHFSEAPKLKSKLLRIAKRLKEGTISFGNPVTDFIDSARAKALTGRIKETEPNAITKEKGEAFEETEAEFGWLDFAAEAEKSMDEITSFAENMTGYTRVFGQKLELRTAELETVKQSKIPGGAAKMHKIAQATALVFKEYAKRTEAELPTLHEAWDRFLKYSTGLFTVLKIAKDEDRDAAITLRDTFIEFGKSVKTTQEKLLEGKKSISKFRGVSRDLTRSSERVVRAFDGVFQELAIGESYISRIINFIDEKTADND